MGKQQRDKGNRGENELVKILPGAVKVSRMYQPGEDLCWEGYQIEVKRRASAFRFDYKNLEDVQILMKRADRERWLVTMPVDTLLDLRQQWMDEGFEAAWEEGGIRD